MSLADARSEALAGRLPVGLVDQIVAHLNPVEIIVFGSQATGRIHQDSDWDLLVVVDDDAPAERIRNIQEARRGVRGAIDLIPCRATTFRDRRDIVGSLPWIAANDGVTVYERPRSS